MFKGVLIAPSIDLVLYGSYKTRLPCSLHVTTVREITETAKLAV